MTKAALKHLAVVLTASGSATHTPEQATAVAGRLFARLAEVVTDTFAVSEATVVLSLFSPTLRTLLSFLADERPQALPEGMERVRRSARAAGAALCVHGSRDTSTEGLGTSAHGDRRPGETHRVVNLFLDYSAREEIARAARRWIAEHNGEEPDEEAFAAALTTAGQPDPDLVIYAGGPLQSADFLLWQCSYAEIWHTARDGQLFSRDDLIRAVAEFGVRQRRFGSL